MSFFLQICPFFLFCSILELPPRFSLCSVDQLAVPSAWQSLQWHASGRQIAVRGLLFHPPCALLALPLPLPPLPPLLLPIFSLSSHTCLCPTSLRTTLSKPQNTLFYGVLILLLLIWHMLAFTSSFHTNQQAFACTTVRTNCRSLPTITTHTGCHPTGRALLPRNCWLLDQVTTVEKASTSLEAAGVRLTIQEPKARDQQALTWITRNY